MGIAGNLCCGMLAIEVAVTIYTFVYPHVLINYWVCFLITHGCLCVGVIVSWYYIEYHTLQNVDETAQYAYILQTATRRKLSMRSEVRSPSPSSPPTKLSKSAWNIRTIHQVPVHVKTD